MLMLGNLPVVSYDLIQALRSAGVSVRIARTFLTIFFFEVLMMCGVLIASTPLLYDVSSAIQLPWPALSDAVLDTIASA
jgi:hypothetical protein